MKKLIHTLTLLVGLSISALAFADVKISDLPAGTALGGTESIPAVQSAATVKTTPAAINTYVQSQTTSATVIGKFTSCSGTKYLGADGVCHDASSGSVTSVGLTAPSVFSVGGSPITASGTLAVTFAGGQTQNQFLASPNGLSGSIGLRSIVAADLPSLSSGISGILPVANGGSGVATLTGIAKGNGTSAFTVAGSSDVIGLWSGTCDLTTFLRGDGSCAPPAAGAVTSVALTAPSGFSVTGSPITSSGTLGITGVLNPVAGGTGVATLSGVLKGNGTSAVTSAASSDVIGLWAGGCGTGTFLKASGNCSSVNLGPASFDISGVLPSDNGGTGSSFFSVSGPATTLKTFTFPNANATVLTTNSAVTVPQGGTGVATLSGVLKGNGTSAVTSAASSDVIGLWSGTCDLTTFLRGDGSCAATSSSTTLTGAVTGTGTGTIATTLAATQSGAHSFTGIIAFQNEVDYLSAAPITLGQNSPSALSSTVNNYNFGSFGCCAGPVYRLTPAAGGSTITGFAEAAGGFYSTLVFNVSATDNITFTNEDSNSTTGNRFLTPNAANFVLHPGEGAQFWYDDTGTARWRIARGVPSPINLASTSAGGVTGILPVANGGTGVATLTAHGVLLGEGTSNVSSVAAMAADTLLQGQGVTSDPAAVAITNCGDSTHALAYSTTTHAFSCQTVTGSGSGVAGSDTQIQYNNAGAFGASAAFTWTDSTHTMVMGDTTTSPVIQALDRSTSGTGVAFLVKAGAGNTTGAGGKLTLKGGAGGASSGQGGGVDVLGGVPTNGNGGSVNLQGSDGVSTGAGASGGSSNVTGGAGVGTGAGGSASMNGGAAGATGSANGVTIAGGSGGSTSGNGGTISLTAGQAPTSGTGGNVTLTGGASHGSAKNGGSIVFTPTIASDSSGVSGTIQLAKWHSDTSYDYTTPTTGFSYTIPDMAGDAILDPAGTLSTGTITMPAKPNDGQVIRISTSQTITTLTLSANTGQSIKNAPATLAAGGKLSYVYRAANTTWYVY